MIAPQNRLIYWTALVTLAAALLAAAEPGALGALITVVAAFVLVAVCDALLASGRLRGVGAAFPEVVRRVRGGQDRDAILTAFVEQQGGIKEMVASYDVQGAQILARPPASGFGSMAYIMPVVAVLFGLGLVGFVFKRLMGEESGAVIEAPSDPSDQTATESSQRRRIEKELADYDF